MEQYKTNWLNYFDMLDANNSNTIEPADAIHAGKNIAKLINKPEESIEVQMGVQVLSKLIDGFIKTFDANSDGIVTKEELLQGVEAMFVGKKYDEFPEFLKASNRESFVIIDKDKKGYLTWEEVQGMLNRNNPTATDEQKKEAYEWVVKRSPAGKYDENGYAHVLEAWATSPKAVPEVQTLTAILRKH